MTGILKFLLKFYLIVTSIIGTLVLVIVFYVLDSPLSQYFHAWYNGFLYEQYAFYIPQENDNSYLGISDSLLNEKQSHINYPAYFAEFSDDGDCTIGLGTSKLTSSFIINETQSIYLSTELQTCTTCSGLDSSAFLIESKQAWMASPNAETDLFLEGRSIARRYYLQSPKGQAPIPNIDMDAYMLPFFYVDQPEEASDVILFCGTTEDSNGNKVFDRLDNRSLFIHRISSGETFEINRKEESFIRVIWLNNSSLALLEFGFDENWDGYYEYDIESTVWKLYKVLDDHIVYISTEERDKLLRQNNLTLP